MKNLFVFIFLLIILFQSASAKWTIGEYWDQDNSFKLKLICDKNDSFCIQLCNHQTNCEIKQAICRDCIGTSILMTNIFDEMGTRYRNTSELVSSYEFIDFIKQGMYSTFSSKSIYNQTDSYDSEILQAKFLSLCPLKTKNPLVFFSLKNTGKILDKVKYVICDNKIFRMSDSPNVILNPNYKKPRWYQFIFIKQ